MPEHVQTLLGNGGKRTVFQADAIFNQPHASPLQRMKEALWRIGRYVGRRVRQARHALCSDWHGARYWSFGLILLLITSLAVIAFYVNHPQVETDPDTSSYLTVTQHILSSGKLVDPVRTPGYPLFIALVFLLAGQGNLAAVSIAQGMLFVAATLEIYGIICLMFRRAWMALTIGLLVGLNIYLIAFVKPVMSESFAMWVVASLALSVTLCIFTLRARYLWLVAAFTLLAFMTHPEWVYAPVPIFAYLLFIAARRGTFRRLLPHALGAVLVLYGCLGLFIYVNATQNGFPGITDVQGINLLGKVIEYNMQNEAPPQYAAITQQLNAYLAAGGERSPYTFALYYPPITANYWALADSYASSIVYHHPVEFFLHTVPVFINSSNPYYAFSNLNAQGPFALPLIELQEFSAQVYFLYRFFPLVALFWLGLLFWRPTRRVQMMGALSLLGLYELALVAAGGYSDMPRLHSSFNPILLVCTWGSVLLLLPPLLSLLRKLPFNKRLARFWPIIKWAWGICIVGGFILSAAVTMLRHGTSALARPETWIGIQWSLNHPARALALLALAGLISLLAYLGYQDQQAAAPKSEQTREEVQPQPGEAPERTLEAEHLP